MDRIKDLIKRKLNRIRKDEEKYLAEESQKKEDLHSIENLTKKKLRYEIKILKSQIEKEKKVNLLKYAINFSVISLLIASFTFLYNTVFVPLNKIETINNELRNAQVSKELAIKDERLTQKEDSLRGVAADLEKEKILRQFYQDSIDTINKNQNKLVAKMGFLEQQYRGAQESSEKRQAEISKLKNAYSVLEKSKNEVQNKIDQPNLDDNSLLLRKSSPIINDRLTLIDSVLNTTNREFLKSILLYNKNTIVNTLLFSQEGKYIIRREKGIDLFDNILKGYTFSRVGELENFQKASNNVVFSITYKVKDKLLPNDKPMFILKLNIAFIVEPNSYGGFLVAVTQGGKLRQVTNH